MNLAVEVANTAGRDPDLLDHDDDRVAWLRATGAPEGTRARDLRALRSAILELVGAALRDAPLPADAVATVNSASARAAWYPQLDGGELAYVARASPVSSFLADIAASAIELVGGPARGRLRACPGSGCGRYFLTSRARHVWCSDACGNRARVARHRAER